MLSLKQNLVKYQKFTYFLTGFFLCIWISSCGFHLAGKKSWLSQAKSLRLEKIENVSKRLGLNFELRKALEFKILKHPELNYTKNLADLNLSIKITRADFSSQVHFNNSSNNKIADNDYYLHLQRLEARLVLKDLRNLSPAQREWSLSNEISLESEKPDLDNYQKTQLQTKNIAELAEKIFDFLTSPDVPRRTK